MAQSIIFADVKVFGSVSHVHIPKALRNKLESHSHSGIVVGYENTNIYCIYMTDTQRIIRARDVHFDETATRSFEEIVDINPTPLFAAATTLSSVSPVSLLPSDSLVTSCSDTTDSFPPGLTRVPNSCYVSSIETVSYRNARSGADRAL